MNDWTRLLVKYKGRCSACGKEIFAGEYALWSKSSKAIKHSKCKALPPQAITEKRGQDKNRQYKTAAVNVYCFICGMPVAADNSGFEEDDHGRQTISQASICNRCLEDKNAYQNYQHAFLEKIQRVAKVKL
jgi:hypothetical protein